MVVGGSNPLTPTKIKAGSDFAKMLPALILVAGTGFGFVRPLAFMVVLGVLPRPFLVLSCVVFSVVCRRCCYMVATYGDSKGYL